MKSVADITMSKEELTLMLIDLNKKVMKCTEEANRIRDYNYALLQKEQMILIAKAKRCKAVLDLKEKEESQ